jgi:hypothetical protein
MASIPQKDRVSLCRYTFSDQRQCRTPRSPHHPHFCFYHARLESQSASAAELADDIAYFFSGDYISANDLSRVLARILPAIIRGDIKPRLAKTIVYLAQTLNQTIQLAQHEYINSFGPNGWRDVIHNGVIQNFKRDNPSAAPEDSAPNEQPDEVEADEVQSDTDQPEIQNHPPVQNQAEPAQETQEKDQREVVFTESKCQDKRKPEADLKESSVGESGEPQAA